MSRMVDTPASRAVDTPAVETLSFEAALQELEGIVRALEGGQGKLEEAVAQYERGAALRKHCESLLVAAEQKVQAIVETPSGPALRDAS